MSFDDCTSVSTNDPSPSEGRRPAVSAAAMHASLYPDASEERESDELEILSVNLTPHGINMDLCRDVAVGSLYNISIGIVDQWLRSHVRITSCQSLTRGLYRVGGEFC